VGVADLLHQRHPLADRRYCNLVAGLGFWNLRDLIALSLGAMKVLGEA